MVSTDRLNHIVFLHLGWLRSGLCGQVVFIPSGLYSVVAYVVLLDGRNLKFVGRWSLFTGLKHRVYCKYTFLSHSHERSLS